MASLVLSPPEEKALRALWNRGPLSRGKLGVDAATVRRLMDAGWVNEFAPARKREAAKLALTEAGRGVAVRVPPVKPTLADLYRELTAAREEIAELRSLIGSRGASAAPSEPAAKAASAAVDPQAFLAALREALGEIDRRGRHGGLVPMGDVRRALAHLGLAREAFDAALLEQERVYAVDLKIANNPAKVKAPDDGIPIEGRGLLYYVVLR